MRARRILLLLLIVLALGLGGGVAALWFSGTLHGRVREQLVASAEASLGREVAVGRLRGDPLRGVVIDDLAVARTDRLSEGAMITAERAEIRFDALALGRDLLTGRGVLPSIRQIVLVSPTLALEVSREGRWNVADLLRRQPAGGGPSVFRPLVEIRAGAVDFSDAFGLRRPFLARFSQVNGTVDLRAWPRVRLAAELVSLRADRATPLVASGTYLAGMDALDLAVSAERAPLVQWGPYFVRVPGFVLDGGYADAAFHVLRTRWGGRRALDYRGTLRLYDAEALLLPQRARLRDAHGVIEVDNLGLRTEALALTVDGSPLRLRGEMISTARGRRLDLTAVSQEMDLTTLRRVLFPGSQLALVGRTGGEVRIRGPMQTLTVEGALYHARGAINAQPFTITRSGVTVIGNLLALDGLSATAGSARVSGEVRHLLGTPELLVAGEAHDLSAEIWRRAGIPLSLPLEGRLDGSVALGRTGDSLMVEAALTMTSGRAGGLRVDGIRAGGWVEDGAFYFPYLVGAQGTSQVHAAGAVAESGRLAMDVAGTDLDLRRISALVGLRPAISGQADVRGRLTGSLAAPVFDGDLVMGRGSAGTLAFDGAEGPLHLTRQSVSTPGLLIRDGPGTYRLAGTAQWAAAHPALDLTVDAEEIAAAALARDAGLALDLRGRLSGRLHIGGTPRRPSVTASLTLREGRLEGQQVDEATAAFRWVDGTLHLDRAEARVRDSLIQASGTVRRDGETEMTISARQFDLRHLTILPPQLLAASGKIDLNGRVSGKGLNRVAGVLSSSDLTLNGQRFDQAEGLVRWAQGRLHLEPLTLRQGPGEYTITGTLELQGPVRFDLQGEVAGGRLSTLLALGGVRPPFPLDGRLDGVVRVEGTPARPSASLDARLSQGRLGDHPIEEGQAVLSARDDVITVERLRLRSGSGEIAAQGRVALRGSSALEVSGSNLNLDLLRPLLGLRRPLRGTLSFTTQFSGALSDPEIGLSLELRDGGVEGLTFDSLVANAFYQDGQFHIEQALLTEGTNRVKGTGTIPFNPALRSLAETRPMRFEISLVEANLGLLTLLTPQVQEASGRMEGQVTLSGTPRAPEMSGRLMVRGGRIKLRSVVTPLEEIAADLIFREDRLTLDSFSTRMGSGTVSATGAVAVADFRPARIERLSVRARDARLEVKPLFAGQVDADLTIAGSLLDAAAPPEIAGTLTLKRGDLVISAAPGGSGWRGPNFRLHDVRVRGGEELAVHLGRVRIDLQEGEVIAGGTLRQPTLDGEWVAERGTMTVFGQTFILREGRARFLPQLGLTPIVSLEAETQLGATRVFIEVHQALPHEMADRMILRSDPPLSREEIAQLLAQHSGLAHLAAGDVQSALRVELSRALFGEIGQTVARALGLTEFVIQYDFAQPLQLRIGRLLVRDLYLTLTTVFEAPRTRFVWALEWRFARNLMFTLSLDNVGRSDALLLYQIRF
ncbi:MAG TPA: translocation/assembly module TamB domain-containing protein [bacterium]|nr:translocation/assembly module TamB domain-containing protein [bacterium]